MTSNLERLIYNNIFLWGFTSIFSVVVVVVVVLNIVEQNA